MKTPARIPISSATGKSKAHFASTTARQIPLALAAASKVDPPCFEVETYAWTVLPPHLRERDLASGIARELAWTRDALVRAGFEVR